MSQPLRIRKALAEVKATAGVDGAPNLPTRGPGRFHADRQEVADPSPATLLQGREYIPANQHTGASGLRSFLDRQIARGLKPREHKDYFSGPNF
jgi:hypothetical protein